MQEIVVNVNGRIVPSSEAKVSVFDRGFMYGDSLYEVVRTQNGQFVDLDEHFNRLKKSAELCRMELSQSQEEYQRQLKLTFNEYAKHSNQDAYCRLIVTRGAGKIGFGLDCIETSTQFVIIVKPIDFFSNNSVQQGVRVQVSKRIRNDRRALDPAMKSGNYLNNLLAHLEARDEGFDDAILCNAEGHLTEGTTFNLFYVKSGVVCTPPLEIGILDGIVRRNTLNILQEAGVPVREICFHKERLYEADEVFLTSSTKDAFPITQVDHRNKKAGPLTLALRKELQKKLLD